MFSDSERFKVFHYNVVMKYVVVEISNVRVVAGTTLLFLDDFVAVFGM